MLVYVLFVLLSTGSTKGGLAVDKYEFKDKVQCEAAVQNMGKQFSSTFYKGYCQEVRK